MCLQWPSQIKKVEKIFGGHFSAKSSKKSFVAIFGVKILKKLLITFQCKNIEKGFDNSPLQCKNIDKILSDHFSVKILKKFLVTIFVTKICDQKVTKFCSKKKCHFLSSRERESRGRQNFFFTFVVLIPERVTRSQLRAFGLASLGKKQFQSYILLIIFGENMS